MKINIVTEISRPIQYLSKFWFSSYGPKCCWSVKLQDSLKCNISTKGLLLFGMQINIEVSKIFENNWNNIKSA